MTAGADLIEDRVTFVEASPRVGLTGAYVASIWPGSRNTMTLADSAAFIGTRSPGRFSDLPGEIHGYTCCEPRSEILLDMVFDTPGEHTITSLGFEHEAGSLHYQTVLTLAVSTPAWYWQQWLPQGCRPRRRAAEIASQPTRL